MTENFAVWMVELLERTAMGMVAEMTVRDHISIPDHMWTLQ
jgi:hypothetical protein